MHSGRTNFAGGASARPFSSSAVGRRDAGVANDISRGTGGSRGVGRAGSPPGLPRPKSTIAIDEEAAAAFSSSPPSRDKTTRGWCTFAPNRPPSPLSPVSSTARNTGLLHHGSPPSPILQSSSPQAAARRPLQPRSPITAESTAARGGFVAQCLPTPVATASSTAPRAGVGRSALGDSWHRDVDPQSRRSDGIAVKSKVAPGQLAQTGRTEWGMADRRGPVRAPHSGVGFLSPTAPSNARHESAPTTAHSRTAASAADANGGGGGRHYSRAARVPSPGRERLGIASGFSPTSSSLARQRSGRPQGLTSLKQPLANGISAEVEDDFALQRAIQMSLQDSEKARMQEKEEVELAARMAEIDGADDAAAAAHALEVAEAAEVAEALAVAERAEAAERLASVGKAAGTGVLVPEQEAVTAVATSDATAVAETPPPASTREEPERAPPMPTPSSEIAQTFAPKRWLSDASIAFAYALLAVRRVPATTASAATTLVSLVADDSGQLPEVVLLMDPATAFWLTAQDDPKHIEEARRALKLQDRQLMVCPINDSCDGSRADAGTHWALLVCWDQRGPSDGASDFHKNANSGAFEEIAASRAFALFEHYCCYDSLGFSSRYSPSVTQARALASRLAGTNVQVSVGSCAKQTNGFDCGVYVLLFSEIIVASFLDALARRPASVFSDASKLIDGRSPTKPPIWQQQLSSVTPNDVVERRMCYRKMFSSFPAPCGSAAVAGA
eukprot:TRINITY_DN38033_c0_g1_i1.p1 TRINITY_DN38033_c0_g1~~TRINITY_DN38033_c0_g1_i1.p1  ORF type:complete len:730 (-),score=131.64 TRINITY_DN38033_c0_g1_i1:562-2751(-)